MQKKISVIIPVYNVMNYIEASFASLLNQTIFQELEIIVVDDGSTDGSGQYCNRLSHQYENIIYIYQSNAGVSAARNNGLSRVTCPYVTFFDPDDLLEENIYEKMLTDIVTERADIVSVQQATPDYSSVSDRVPQLVNSIYRSDNKYIILRDYLRDGSFSPSVVDKLFSWEVIKELRFDESIKVHEDGLFVFQALTNSKKVYFDTRGIYYHVVLNMTSATRSKFEYYRFTALTAIKKMIDLCDDDLKDFGRTYLIYYMLILIKIIYQQGEQKHFRNEVQEMKDVILNYDYKRNKQYFPNNITRKKLELFAICPSLFLYLIIAREKIRNFNIF